MFDWQPRTFIILVHCDKCGKAVKAGNDFLFAVGDGYVCCTQACADALSQRAEMLHMLEPLNHEN